MQLSNAVEPFKRKLESLARVRIDSGKRFLRKMCPEGKDLT
jgi:hypothetical protein